MLSSCMVNIVISLYFAHDWEMSDNNDKDSFLTRAFQFENQTKFTGLGDAECLHLMSHGQATAFEKWKKKHEPLATARKHLLDLYRVLGPGVLLDPFWTVQNIVKRSRHGSFVKLISAVLTDAPYVARDLASNIPLPIVRRNDTLHAVLAVSSALDPALGDFVSRFIHDIPDSVEDMVDYQLRMNWDEDDYNLYEEDNNEDY
ncbi:hypothetical protein B0H10DRAFT_1284206 [Mycena sp. CBHHK59/15]|nr:hypothetical protein B0H10DRAFT_1284206 [Mycena sp. CBHHK59/15]